MQEQKQSVTAHFITLTYDTKHVPITRNGFMELKKKDLQLFFKRLRKAQGPALQIKYYAAGEYGTKTKRPHYHIIMFNANIALISPAWNLGEVHYGEVTGASVGYTLKYMSKPSCIPMHRNDDRLKEFSLMSKQLGANYLTPQMITWHTNDLVNRTYCNLTDGKKITMPRYYKNKIYGPTTLPDENGNNTIPNPLRKKIATEGAIRNAKKLAQNLVDLGEDMYHLQALSDVQKFKSHHINAVKDRDKI